MMKLQLFIIALIMSVVSYGQDKIDFNYSKDYASILKSTKDSKSDVFYKDLFKRFEKADSTLTNYEMLALQIGYSDNPNYLPYQDIALEREIWSLNEKKEFDLAEKKLDTLLAKNPFSILGNREMSYVQKKLGNTELATLYYAKFDLVVLSVLSTGDGLSYETSWFTLSPADGQWIIKLVFRAGECSMGSGSDTNGSFHDILGIKFEDSENCKPLYFNIDTAAKRMFGLEGLKIDDKSDLNEDKKQKSKKKVKEKK